MVNKIEIVYIIPEDQTGVAKVDNQKD